MRVGLFMAPQWQPGADLGTGIRELRELVRAARENGFSSLLLGQHMLTAPMQMLQTMPLLAALLREAEGMQIGPGVLLLSMVSPVLAAEEGATLDWLSDGNFVLAAGLGYRPEEFEALGAPMAERVSRLTEALEVVKRLWSEDRVTHAGRHFRLTDVGCSVRPKQQPRPPIWLGGDVEAAVKRAARLADAWIAAPTNDFERLSELLGVFRAEREAAGLPPAACPVIRECFVGRDREHARRASRAPLLYKYEAYASWGQTDTAGAPLAERFEEFAADRFIIGDPGFAREQMQRYAESLGVEHLLLRVQWPGLESSEAIGNLERIGKVAATIA